MSDVFADNGEIHLNMHTKVHLLRNINNQKMGKSRESHCHLMYRIEEKIGIWCLNFVQGIFTVHNFCLHRHNEGVFPAIRFQ